MPSSYLDRFSRCRAGAQRCRLAAENARSTEEEVAWLDLADDWDILAEAFEQEEARPEWLH